VFGVSFDSPDDNAAFAKKNDFPFKLLSDEEGKVARAYGAFDPARPKYAMRNTYVISPEGKIERVFEKVDFKKNPQEVLDALPEK
jgi:peroxiredoxin Q/BCP